MAVVWENPSAIFVVRGPPHVMAQSRDSIHQIRVMKIKKKLTNDAHSGTLMTCQFVITGSVDFTYEII